MEKIGAMRQVGADAREPQIQFLVADDDRLERSLLAACARDIVAEIVVLEAEDGAEAIQLGLQRGPEIALLDINMPRLGGIEAAVTLRELKPGMRLALQTGDPLIHRERAQEHRLPLFSKLEPERTLTWLRAQVEWWNEAHLESEVPGKRGFVCGACGYGALRAVAPDRCPMCHFENTWIDAQQPASRMLMTG
jgi:CheY-like chemotaxis protein